MQTDPEPTPGAQKEKDWCTAARLFREHWKPKPIQPPNVDPNLEELGGIQRSAEVFRYSILSIEWWLSPNGRLREWLRLNGKISSVLLIPAAMVVPLVSYLMWNLGFWVALLVGIAGNLVVLPATLLLAGSIFAGIRALLRAIFGR